MLQYLKFPDNITLIYGPPASGKTTLVLQILLNTKGKIVFIDTENCFNTERLKQIKEDVNLDNIILLKAKRYSEQFAAVKSLKEMKNISLVIIDSFTKYHRRKIQENINIRPATIKMFIMLRELKIPVILTSQVYSDMNNKFHPIAEHLFKNFSKYTIKLDNNKQRILTIENTNVKIPFIITNEGLIE